MANNIYELDFTGVEVNSYIPEGTHNVKVSAAEFKKAQTGSDQLQVTFQAEDGSVRNTWFSLLPQALWKLKGFLETIGVPCEGKIKLNTKQIEGKYCTIIVEPDQDDETKLVVSRISKLERGNQTVAYNAPVAPSVMPNAAPQTPAAPQTFVPPVQNAAAPQPTPAGQAALPPWMQPNAAQAPQGNLPPWMKQ